MDATSGVLPFNSNRTSQSQGKEQGDAKEQSDRNKQIQMTFLNSVASDFYRLLHLDEDFKDKPIDIQVTSDGLRVTLFDRAKQPIFAPGSTELTEWGTFALQNLAWLIDRHHFNVTIDGHARTNQPNAKPNYSNWELSADRANAARRTLVHYAVAPELVERVIGYADTKPLPGESADAESNERVTLNLTLTAKGRSKENKVSQRAPAGSTGATAAATP
jgi:chemotaxis protein MotB